MGARSFGRLNLKCEKATSMSYIFARSCRGPTIVGGAILHTGAALLDGQHVHVCLIWGGWNMERIEGSGLAFVRGHL